MGAQGGSAAVLTGWSEYATRRQHLSRDLQEMRHTPRRQPEEEHFQVEETASAKPQRWEKPWLIRGLARRPE